MSHECHIVQIEDMKGSCRSDNVPQKHKIGADHLAEGFFILVSVFSLVFWRETSAIRNLAVTFVAIVFEALPFMLLGSLAGGLMEVYVSQERMTQVIPTGKRGVFIAAGLGFVFPICECAVVLNPGTQRSLSLLISFHGVTTLLRCLSLRENMVQIGPEQSI